MRRRWALAFKDRRFAGVHTAPPVDEWPKFENVEIIEHGRAIGVLLREWDGTISAIRIPIEQLAD